MKNLTKYLKQYAKEVYPDKTIFDVSYIIEDDEITPFVLFHHNRNIRPSGESYDVIQANLVDVIKWLCDKLASAESSSITSCPVCGEEWNMSKHKSCSCGACIVKH